MRTNSYKKKTIRLDEKYIYLLSNKFMIVETHAQLRPLFLVFVVTTATKVHHL